MFDYLNKFNDLEPYLKEAVSSSEAIKKIEELEGEFKIDLASLIMRVIVKEININDLPFILFTEFSLGQEQSELLSNKLKEGVFSSLASYLGFSLEKKDEPDLVEEKNIDDASVTKIDSNDFLEGDDFTSSKIKRNEKRRILPSISSLLGEDYDLSDDSDDNIGFIEDDDLSEGQDILGAYRKAKHREDLNSSLMKIFAFLNLKLEDEQKDKFLGQLDKYLRGIKTRAAVRQIFSDNIDSGGFGLSDEMIDDLFHMAERMKEQEYQELKKDIYLDEGVLQKINKLGYGKALPEGPSPLLLAPQELPLSLTAFEPQKDSLPAIRDNLSLSKAGSKKDDELIEEEPKKKEEEGLLPETESSSKDYSEVEEKQESSVTSRGPITNNLHLSRDGSKIKMTDIKKVRVTGPIDEIRYLDLVNFRRLSNNPEEAFEKIRQKLKILESIDYGKMLEGIKAWRQNPINKTYLKIFAKASNEGISIDQVIENFKKEEKDYLSRQEIDALLKFNKSLLF